MAEVIELRFFMIIKKSKIFNFILDNKELFIAIDTAFVEFSIVKLFFIVRFLTNDDTGIQTTYAYGYPFQQFVNVWLGYFMCWIYKIAPGISWWYWWSILCQLVGTSLFLYSILKVSQDRKKAFTVITFFFLSFGAFYFSLVAFTIVPCVLAIGGISLLFTHKGQKAKVSHLIIPFITIIIASMHRYESGIEMLCFLFVGIIFYVFSTEYKGLRTGPDSFREITLKRILYAVIIFLVNIVFVLVVLGSSRFIKMENEADDYYDFTNYRSVFADFPVDTYDENPEGYLSAGWDRNIYELARQCCYLPKEVTTDSLKLLSDSVSKNTGIISIIENTIKCIHIKSIREYVRSLQKYDGLVRLFSSLYLMFIGLLLIISIAKKGTLSLGEGCMVLTLIGVSGLTLVLWLTGRNILRAYLIIFIPFVAFSLLLLINEFQISERANVIIFGVVAIFAINLYGFSLSQARGEFDDSYRKILEYAKENSDKLYCFSDSSLVGLGGETVVPANMIYWGGTDWYTDYNRYLLEEYGLDELTFDTLTADDVFYLGRDDDTSITLFEEYYNNKQICVDIEQIESVENYYVYKISKRIN